MLRPAARFEIEIDGELGELLHRHGGDSRAAPKVV